MGIFKRGRPKKNQPGTVADPTVGTDNDVATTPVTPQAPVNKCGDCGGEGMIFHWPDNTGGTICKTCNGLGHD